MDHIWAAVMNHVDESWKSQALAVLKKYDNSSNKATKYLNDLDEMKFGDLLELASPTEARGGKGDCDSMHRLACWLRDGSRGVPANVSEGLDWAKKLVVQEFGKEGDWVRKAKQYMEAIEAGLLKYQSKDKAKATSMLKELDVMEFEAIKTRADAAGDPNEKAEWNYKVGEWLLRGTSGVRQDVSRGLDYIELAVRSTHDHWKGLALKKLQEWDVTLVGGDKKAKRILDELDREEHQRQLDLAPGNMEIAFKVAHRLCNGSRGVKANTNVGLDWCWTILNHNRDHSTTDLCKPEAEKLLQAEENRYFAAEQAKETPEQKARREEEEREAKLDLGVRKRRGSASKSKASQLLDRLDKLRFDELCEDCDRNPTAAKQYRIGEWLINGSEYPREGVLPNLEEGFEYIFRATGAGEAICDEAVKAKAIRLLESYDDTVGNIHGHKVAARKLDDLDRISFEEKEGNALDSKDPNQEIAIGDHLCKGSRGVPKDRATGCDWYYKAYTNTNTSQKQRALDAIEYLATDWPGTAVAAAMAGEPKAKTIMDEVIADLQERVKRHEWAAEKAMAERYFKGKWVYKDIKQAIDLITEGCERGEDPAWNFLHESAGKSHSDQRAAPTTAFRIVLHQTLCDFWTKGSGQIPKDKAMAEKERSATSRLKTQLKMEEHQKWVEENGEMGDGNDIGSLGGGGI